MPAICSGRSAPREVRIVRGAVSPDHIHMLVVVPPQLAPAKLVQFLKGRSSRMLQRDFQYLRKRYWGALSRLSAGAASGGFQPQADFQSEKESTGCSR